MRLEIKRRSNGGAVWPQLYVVHHINGRRKRTYVRAGDASRVINEFKACRASETPKTPKPPKGSVRRGRKHILPPELYEFAQKAGYERRGIQLSMSRANFFTVEAAAVRFSLLDDDVQAAIGNPERLHQANIKANSLLKRRNRLSQTTSYQECLAETLASAKL